MSSDTETLPDTVLSTRSLRYLHEIEVHGGVRAAADALSINGSVISRQVAQLERVHGVALLERRGRRVTLTEIGHSLVEHFRESARRERFVREWPDRCCHPHTGRDRPRHCGPWR